MSEAHFVLRNGILLKEDRRVVNIDKAVEILSSKKQKRYTSAVRRDEGDAILVSHYYECPHCRNRVPAYPRYTNGLFNENKRIRDKVERDKVHKWGQRQISIFDNENSEIFFNAVVENKLGYRCPECNGTVYAIDCEREVTVTCRRGKISVTTEIISFAELASFPCFCNKNTAVTFPIYEKTVFNLNKGRCCLEVTSADGAVLFKRDVTDSPEAVNGALPHIIKESKSVKRYLYRLFLSKQGKIAFSAREMSFEKFVLITRFGGFDRRFYDCIPFKDECCAVHKSFRHLLRHFVNGDRLCRFYERSGLPSMKSVRRYIFEHAGLLFYTDGLEILWRSIGDPNLFLRVMDSDTVFNVISDLHSYPAIGVLLDDFSVLVGKAPLVRAVNECWGAVTAYGKSYVAMSAKRRREEQRDWNSRLFCDRRCRGRESVSLPMTLTTLADTAVEGFYYQCLRSGREYKLAASVLHNCLGTWHGRGSAVVVVKRHGVIVAAIEILGRVITQAYAQNNQEISTYPELNSSYTAWKKKYGLEESDDADLDMFENDNIF